MISMLRIIITVGAALLLSEHEPLQFPPRAGCNHNIQEGLCNALRC